MTYEEVGALLNTLKATRSRADRARELVEKIESDSGAIASGIAPKLPSGNLADSKVERLAIKLYEAAEAYRRALDEYFEIEDRLTEIINNDLTDEERDIIVSHYVLGYSFRKIVREINYSERMVFYKLEAAKRKIARGLSVNDWAIG